MCIVSVACLTEASVSTDFLALYKRCYYYCCFCFLFIYLFIFCFRPSGVKIPRVKSKVKSKRKAEVVTPRR